MGGDGRGCDLKRLEEKWVRTWGPDPQSGEGWEARLLPWSLDQDSGVSPRGRDFHNPGFRWSWDECLFPPHVVRERNRRVKARIGLRMGPGTQER